MTANKKVLGRGRLMLILLAGMLLAFNFFATVYHTRIDLTDEKKFTVSAATKKILKKPESPVTIHVLLKGNYPSGFRNLAAASADMLREFREIAGSKLKYEIISPEETVIGSETTYADSLYNLGFIPINLTSQLKEGQQQQFVFPCAVIHYRDRMLPVTLYKGKSPFISPEELNSASALLEYNLASGIARLTDSLRPVIGYLTGHGEPLPGQMPVYDLFEQVLKPNYNVFTFNLNAQPAIPEVFDLIMMVKPRDAFSDAAKLKIDQYVMRGGKMLVFMDRLEAEMDSLQIRNQVIAYDRNLGINDLLFRYGVRVNPNLIMDLQCDYLPFDISGDGQFEFLPWNYFPVLESSGDHPVNRNLGFVCGRFVNSIDTVEAEGISKTILLHSSLNSRIIGSPALISGAENVNAAKDEKFNRSGIPAAVLLEGKFRSLYDNRLSGALRDSLAAAGRQFVSRGQNDSRIIVAGDGDLVLNSAQGPQEPLAMGLNPYTYGSQRQFPFANRDFLLNAISFLTDEYGLSETRSRDQTMRLLDVKRTRAEKTYWQLLNIAVPVLVILVFGFIFQSFRRRRFARKIIS